MFQAQAYRDCAKDSWFSATRLRRPSLTVVNGTLHEGDKRRKQVANLHYKETARDGTSATRYPYAYIGNGVLRSRSPFGVGIARW